MEHGAGLGWAADLEASPLGLLMRQSFFAYPLANVLHVVGIALLLGSIVALDLRLLGLGRGLALVPAARFLAAVSIAGLLIAVPSGVAMFLADASALAQSTAFRVKLALVALSLVNAIAFRWAWRGRLADWDWDAPRLGQTQAVASVLLWVGAVAGGRLIAYF